MELKDLLDAVSSEPAVRAALVTASATCLSSVVGFTAVVWQIGRQGKNAIRANKQSEALKRKIEIYEQTLETSKKAQDAASAVMSYLRRFEVNVSFARAVPLSGLNPPRERFQ